MELVAEDPIHRIFAAWHSDPADLRLPDLLKVEPGQLPAEAEETAPVRLLGTKFLPHLAGCSWEPSSPSGKPSIGKSAQLQIRRTRLRVEILKKESDPLAKYELFQRLIPAEPSLVSRK